MSSANDVGEQRDRDSKPRRSRARKVALVVIGVVAALIAIGLFLRFGVTFGIDPHADDPTPAGSDVRAYFGDLREGITIDGARLVHVYGIHAGAIPVVLAAKDGSLFQVDLLRREELGPQGIALTNYVGLYAVFTGDGATDPAGPQRAAVDALAGALRGRETGGAKPPALASFEERRAAHPNLRFNLRLE